MFVRFLVVYDLLFNLFRIASWERAVHLVFLLCCFYFSAVLIVGIPFPFGVEDIMWYSIVSVPDRCLCIYFENVWFVGIICKCVVGWLPVPLV